MSDVEPPNPDDEVQPPAAHDTTPPSPSQPAPSDARPNPAPEPNLEQPSAEHPTTDSGSSGYPAPGDPEPGYSGQPPGYGGGPGYTGEPAFGGGPSYGPRHGAASEYNAAPGYSSAPEYGPAPDYRGGPEYGPGYGTGPGYGQPTTPLYGQLSDPDGQASDQPPTGRREMDARRSRRAILIAAIIAAVIGGGIGAATVALSDNDPASSNSSAAGLNVSTQAAPAPKLDGSVTAAAKKISPSVATINVNSQQEQDTGSGVIIRADGYILTNNHVIAAAADGAGTISVTLNSGKISSARIVGRDPSDDLAVVKVAATGLPAASFASSRALQVGQSVVAVGAPLGLSDTVTAGIVSNTARPVQTGENASSEAVFDAIQTDAAINPGNSGGPLVNLNGDVVGINAAIATDQSNGGLQVPGQQSGNIGIGFAIPSDEASRIAAELIANGKATHAIIGATVAQTASSTSVGAKIQSVVPGGPAAKAGMKAGDVVTQVDTQRIDGPDALVAAIRSHAPHTKVTIAFQRSGNHTVMVTLGEAAS